MTAAIVVTASLPFLAAVLVGKLTIDRLGAMATQPELGVAMERALGVYADLAAALKEGMRHEVAAMAADPRLRAALTTATPDDDTAVLDALAAEHPRVTHLSLDLEGAAAAIPIPPETPLPGPRGSPPTRGGPSEVDQGDSSERPSTTRRPAGPAPISPSSGPRAPSQVDATTASRGPLPGAGGGSRAQVAARATSDVAEGTKQLTVRASVPGSSATLVATLATSGARFAEQERLAAFHAAYRELEGTRRHAYVETPHLVALTAVMLLTIAAAAVAGAWVARPVTRGVERLTRALRGVAAGDLRPRVAFESGDELGALGRTLNATLVELERSRTRIEFLRHMGEWQKIARRLAHEIRNPLTPIQLAVQECQRRYTGADPDFVRVLTTTVEVVEEEVASLRRLVGRFGRFARLPDAEPAACDLGDVLRDQIAHLQLLGRSEPDDDGEGLTDLEISLETPTEPLPTLLDREMFHRALLNLVRNAAQASRTPRPSARSLQPGKVVIRAGGDEGEVWVAVDDAGPGIDPSVATTLFDPYVTTKPDGSGLGLSIVKKIALDHDGTVEAGRSPEGGARIVLRFPRRG